MDEQVTDATEYEVMCEGSMEMLQDIEVDFADAYAEEHASMTDKTGSQAARRQLEHDNRSGTSSIDEEYCARIATLRDFSMSATRFMSTEHGTKMLYVVRYEKLPPPTTPVQPHENDEWVDAMMVRFNQNWANNIARFAAIARAMVNEYGHEPEKQQEIMHITADLMSVGAKIDQALQEGKLEEARGDVVNGLERLMIRD